MSGTRRPSPRTAHSKGRPGMELRYLWKDEGSGMNGCPALYKAEGGYVVQGVKLDDETRANLRALADGEDAVWVPANVIDRIREIG